MKTTRETWMKKMGMRALAAPLCLLLLASGAKQAAAQCETPPQPVAAAAAMTAAQSAAVTAMTAAIIAAVETQTSLARSVVVTAMDLGWNRIHDRLNQFWREWQQAQKDQTAQLHAGMLDSTRQIASVHDARDHGEAARTVQKLEYDARKEFLPADEGCRFDTTARYMSRAMRVSKAVSTGGAGDVSAALNNKRGTPGEAGKGAVIRDRFRKYQTLFCDPATNGGNAGCTAPGPLARANVTPSKTLFGRPTLDLTTTGSVTAVNELVRNITGYEENNLMKPNVLDAAAGKEQRMADRERMTQVDVIAALVWSIVGERTPGEAAPEVQSGRQRIGVMDASDTPSEYELRTKIVEELWDPAYYAGLQDASATTTQKEIYLKAYSTLMLNKLIEKTEKISNMYVVQTANMLDRYGSIQASGEKYDPKR